MATEPDGDPTLSDLESLLSHDDWMHRRDGVERATELLRTRPGADVVAAIAGHLERLSGDESWDVRHVVARAVQHLHHAAFDRIISRLLEDPSAYVKSAAETSFKRRRRVVRGDERREEDLDSVVAAIDALRSRCSPEVAERAIGVGRAYYEFAAATTTHDILGILTALRELLKSHRAELARRRVPKKAWEATLDKADRRCQTIQSIADSMKMFADRTPPEFRKENVRAMVSEAVGIVRDRLKAEAAPPEVELNLSIEKQLAIDAPRLKLVQVLTNVIRNAFEAIDGEGVVSITAKVNDRAELVLRVTDNGCGIAAEDLDSVFLPGISTKKKKQDRTDCTGFGLAITHKIIEGECRGTLRIESEEGAGTTVTIVLPVEQPREGTQP